MLAYQPPLWQGPPPPPARQTPPWQGRSPPTARRPPPARRPPWQGIPRSPCAVHTGRYGQQARGMHPTGMQFLLKDWSINCFILVVYEKFFTFSQNFLSNFLFSQATIMRLFTYQSEVSVLPERLPSFQYLSVQTQGMSYDGN